VIPRHAVAAIVTTALGLVLLFSFKTPSELARAGTDGRTAVVVGTPSAAAASASAAGSSTASQAPAAPSLGLTPAPSAARSPATPTAPQGSSAPSAGPAAGAADGQFSGPVVNTRYGPVQVQVTISNGALVEVQALQLPDSDPHSAQLSQYAEPILRSAALQAQSAQVDTVSGATYTSRAYAQSLQAALDSAGF
jgi:uncharacterized protein with FMN-binding domain